MNKKQIEEFKNLTKPISDWLYKNGNPHSTVVITQAFAEKSNGEIAIQFEIKD